MSYHTKSTLFKSRKSRLQTLAHVTLILVIAIITGTTDQIAGAAGVATKIIQKSNYHHHSTASSPSRRNNNNYSKQNNN